MILKSYEIQKNISNFSKYNLLLLYGENDGLKKDIKELFKVNLNKLNKKIEILSLYEDDIIANKENLYDLVFSGSLFSDQKVIMINNGTDKIFSTIEDILPKFPENIFLIILSNILEKKSKLRKFFEINNSTLCIPCYLDGERDLRMIAIDELKKNKINLSNESIGLLIEKSNKDRNNLRNEIEKIKMFSHNQKNLDINDIKSIINFSGEYKSDELINECLCGNILQYKKILSELYSNSVNQIFLLRVLGNKIQRLLNMKELESKHNNLDSLLNASKPPIFWKEKPLVRKQLAIWNLKNLKKIIEEINNTEILCKKNPKISKVISFSLFSKICKDANNYS